ncbi:hypothetical protein JCM6882_007181 [Rhodosporidiobolus microsporus]
MQGPRLPSHYSKGVPDLVPPPSSSTTKRPPPFDTARSRPSSPASNSSGASNSSRIELDDLPSDRRNARGKDNPGGAGGGGEEAPGGGGEAAGAGASGGRDLEAADGKEGDKLPWTQRAYKGFKRHLAFVGPGVIASVAYLDPGNWSTDLAAGSAYGYSHLFIILFAGLVALLFQILSTRLGCVSDYDLATQCRFALYDRPGRFKLWYRYGLLWPLYLLAEAGIIFTDLAELLGSAIAINLLIPAIPLWAAVLLTSLDVFLILLLFNQYPARTVTTSMRCFELLIGLLVLTVLGSFVALLVKISPVWKDVFLGYVPRSGIIQGGGIYIAVGIVGATVMPHAFYIGSKMATMRRLKPSDYGESDDTLASRDFDDYEDSASSPVKPSSGTSASPSASPSPRGRPARPYLPSLHLPQPFSLDGRVGFDLGALSRARSRSNSPAPVGRRGRGARGARGKEVEVEEIEEEELEGEEGGEVKKAAMDDLAPSSSSPAALPSTASRRPSAHHARSHPSRPKPTLACIRAHLSHASWDIAGSLLGFAVVVNSCILIMGASVFYYGPGRAGNPDGVSDLFDAYDLVKDYLGQAFAYLFAVALLAAGQSASLTVTLSGQIVSEGFINWRTKPWKRRLITRCLNIVPSLAVAAAIGRSGISTLLVASQVALSIVLTFVLLPLIVFTSQHSIMAVPLPSSSPSPPAPPPSSPPPSSAPKSRLARLPLLRTLNPLRRRHAPPGHFSYANAVPVVWLCGALWLLIGIANVYALIDVGRNGP